jgi:DNA primase
MVAMLLKRGGVVNVWLDPDKAGREGAAKIIKQLHAYGVQTRNILSARDPKLHSREEIKEILNGTSNPNPSSQGPHPQGLLQGDL